MQAPPPMGYMPPPKKSRTGLIVGVIIGVIALCCLLPAGLIIGFGAFAAKDMIGLAGCMISMPEIRDATMDYARDHDNKLPDAKTWQSDIEPYYTSATVRLRSKKSGIPIPDAHQAFVCDDKAKTGIAFNRDLSGKSLTDLKAEMYRIVVFEVDHQGKNLNEPYKERDPKSSPKMMGSLPRGWLIQPLQGPVIQQAQGGRMELNPGAGISDGPDNAKDTESDGKNGGKDGDGATKL